MVQDSSESEKAEQRLYSVLEDSHECRGDGRVVDGAQKQRVVEEAAQHYQHTEEQHEQWFCAAYHYYYFGINSTGRPLTTIRQFRPIRFEN